MKKAIKKILLIVCITMFMLVLLVSVNAEENTDICIGIMDDTDYIKGDEFEFDIDPDSVTKICIDKLGRDVTIKDRAIINAVSSLLSDIGGVEFGKSRYTQPLLDIYIYTDDESIAKYKIITGWDDRYCLGDYTNCILVDNKEMFTRFDELTRGLYNDIVLNKFRCGQTLYQTSLLLGSEQVAENDENCAIFTLEHPDASKSYYLHVWFAEPVRRSSLKSSIKYKLYQGDKLIDEGDPVSQGDRSLVEVDLKRYLKDTDKNGCSSSVGILPAGLTAAAAVGYVFGKKRRK